MKTLPKVGLIVLSFILFIVPPFGTFAAFRDASVDAVSGGTWSNRALLKEVESALSARRSP